MTQPECPKDEVKEARVRPQSGRRPLTLAGLSCARNQEVEGLVES